jgi:hypothetical protein
MPFLALFGTAVTRSSGLRLWTAMLLVSHHSLGKGTAQSAVVSEGGRLCVAPAAHYLKWRAHTQWSTLIL